MSRVPLGSSAAGADPFGSRLRARYPEGLVNQGVSAELIAAKWGFSRDELDGYAARSHALAAEAGESGAFATEVVPVAGVDRLVDETVRPGTTVDSLAGLNPSFRTDALAERFPDVAWNITPGNSSPLTDGASAALIMSADAAEKLGLQPRARFRAI
jgi:acetyl-CoA acyltransferase